MELENLLNTFVTEEIPVECFASQLAKGHHLNSTPCSVPASQAGRGWHTLQTLVYLCSLQCGLESITEQNYESEGTNMKISKYRVACILKGAEGKMILVLGTCLSIPCLTKKKQVTN